MTGVLAELRYALRTLRRSPGFASVAVLTLALGIGANAAVFSVVRGILLRPLPYRDVDRLMIANLSVPDFRDLRDANRSFDRVASFASRDRDDGSPDVRGHRRRPRIRGPSRELPARPPGLEAGSDDGVAKRISGRRKDRP